MIRHIFIGTFKKNLSDEVKNKELEDLRAIKEKIPCVIDIQANFSKGWAGEKGQMTMTVDLADEENFKKYVSHTYHADYLMSRGAEVFENYISSQIEF